MKQGKLIVIEGGDAAGKRTQSGLLAERLATEGYTATVLSFPRYTQNYVGRLLRESVDGKRGDFLIIDSRILATVFAADRVETLPHLREARVGNDVIILDRYTTASMLHQGAKVADADQRHQTMQWIYELEHERLGIPVPDLVIGLALPAKYRMEWALKRRQEKGLAIDTSDIASDHQSAVDIVLPELPKFYRAASIVEGLAGEQVRSVADIQTEVYQKVRAIL